MVGNWFTTTLFFMNAVSVTRCTSLHGSNPCISVQFVRSIFVQAAISTDFVKRITKP